MPRATFGEYPKWFKGYTSYDDLDGIAKHDVEKKIQQCDVVFFINPNQPSGTSIDSEWILTLADTCANITFIVDESFIEFSQTVPNPSVVDLVDKYPNLMIIKSMSKNYGVPGLRLGYIVSGNKLQVERLRKNIPIWSINSIAQAFLENLSKYQTEFLASCQQVIASTQTLYRDLERISGVKPYPTEGNYILCELGANITGHQAGTTLLQKYGILISDRGNKGGLTQHFIRIASRTDNENSRVTAALKDIYSSKQTTRTIGSDR